MRKLVLVNLLIVAFALLACVNCYAQTVSPTTASESQANPADSETLKLLEITNIRLEAANKTIDLLNKRIADKDLVIKTQGDMLALRGSQVEIGNKMDRNSQGIETVDQVRVEACQNQLAKADAEIHRLRNPGFFASLFDRRSLTGAIVGFGIGRATANQNPFVR